MIHLWSLICGLSPDWFKKSFEKKLISLTESYKTMYVNLDFGYHTETCSSADKFACVSTDFQRLLAFDNRPQNRLLVFFLSSVTYPMGLTVRQCTLYAQSKAVRLEGWRRCSLASTKAAWGHVWLLAEPGIALFCKSPCHTRMQVNW